MIVEALAVVNLLTQQGFAAPHGVQARGSTARWHRRARRLGRRVVADAPRADGTAIALEGLAEQRVVRTMTEIRIWRTISVIGLAVTLDGTTAGAQQPGPNLVERARAQGDIGIAGMTCGSPPTLNGLIQNADVILIGTVIRAEGRLSDDLYEVWTDYRVEPSEILRSRPSAESTMLPFALRGGVVLVEGRQISESYEQCGQRLSMTVDQQVVVFGALRDNRQRFDVTAVFLVVGRWAFSDGKLDGFDAAGAPLDQFLESIRAVAGPRSTP